VTPKPLQKPTPHIWIGGDSKRSMTLAAELGDGWLVHGHQPHEIDRIKAYEKVGMTRFILIFLDPEDTEWFAQDVLPLLN